MPSVVLAASRLTAGSDIKYLGPKIYNGTGTTKWVYAKDQYFLAEMKIGMSLLFTFRSGIRRWAKEKYIT